MQVHFSFPEGLVLIISLDTIPRHGEIVDVSQVNDPGFFESPEEYTKFDGELKLKVWKVNLVSYRLLADGKSNVIIELTEKEDSQTYSVM